MFSCDTDLEVGDIPMSGIAILVKELLSGEASPDHLFTDLPGRYTNGLMGQANIFLHWDVRPLHIGSDGPHSFSITLILSV